MNVTRCCATVCFFGERNDDKNKNRGEEYCCKSSRPRRISKLKKSDRVETLISSNIKPFDARFLSQYIAHPSPSLLLRHTHARTHAKALNLFTHFRIEHFKTSSQ